MEENKAETSGKKRMQKMDFDYNDFCILHVQTSEQIYEQVRKTNTFNEWKSKCEQECSERKITKQQKRKL